MHVDFEAYDSRVVSEAECVFWHETLGRRSDVVYYNWSRAPQEALLFVNRVSPSYNNLWVESDRKTGNDPVLFGNKNSGIYLLARWGTDESPLRTEEQIMLSYQRKVAREAVKDNSMIQAWLFVFEGILAIGAAGFFVRYGFGYVGVALLASSLLLAIGHRRFKNRGLNTPLNVWEQQALQFVKQRQGTAA